MSAFYDFLERGESKAEALRQAKLRLKKDSRYRHPHFWAPYILVGEEADPVAFPQSWITIGLGAGLLVTLAAAIVYRRYRRS